VVAVSLKNLSKWLLKTAIFFGIVGGAGYLGYRLLSKKQVTDGQKSNPAQLTSGKKSADQFQAELERFKEENKRMDEQLKKLS
jgi:predicted negative regulator of RcsB-dependent stress response